MEKKSKTPEQQVRLCLTCSLPIPTTRQASAVYCSVRCKNRALQRRAKGLPISDFHFHQAKSGSTQGTSGSEVEVPPGNGTSTFTPSSTSPVDLAQELIRLEAKNRKLEKKNQRLKKKNRKLHMDLAGAKGATVTAQNQARHTKLQTVDNVRAELEDLAEKKAELERLLSYHQPRSEQFDEAEEDVKWADNYLLKSLVSFKKELTEAQQNSVLLEKALGTSVKTIHDYLHFAQWYFKARGTNRISQADKERLQRLQMFLSSGGLQEVERLKKQRQKEAWQAYRQRHIPPRLKSR